MSRNAMAQVFVLLDLYMPPVPILSHHQMQAFAKPCPGDLPHNICLVFHTLWEDVGAISDYAL